MRVPEGRKDEIGELMDSFNYMVDKINTLIRQVYQEKIAQKNAEVQALQAQINPHFLYNTLDMIQWFAEEGMLSQIEEAVSLLQPFIGSA